MCFYTFGKKKSDGCTHFVMKPTLWIASAVCKKEKIVTFVGFTIQWGLCRAVQQCCRQIRVCRFPMENHSIIIHDVPNCVTGVQKRKQRPQAHQCRMYTKHSALCSPGLSFVAALYIEKLPHIRFYIPKKGMVKFGWPHVYTWFTSLTRLMALMFRHIFAFTSSHVPNTSVLF